MENRRLYAVGRQACSSWDPATSQVSSCYPAPDLISSRVSLEFGDRWQKCQQAMARALVAVCWALPGTKSFAFEDKAAMALLMLAIR